MKTWILLTASFLCLGVLACQQQAKAEKPAPTADETAPKADAPTQKVGPVTRLVFVGQKKACDCTRARIDEGWSVLQAALAKAKPVEVQRIARDVDEAEAARLVKIKPLMVAPGLYFFDAKGQLVELMQGALD